VQTCDADCANERVEDKPDLGFSIFADAAWPRGRSASSSAVLHMSPKQSFTGADFARTHTARLPQSGQTIEARTKLALAAVVRMAFLVTDGGQYTGWNARSFSNLGARHTNW